MSYRNNHVEVMPFIGKTVDSELSGNIIDICPVGALTSKPFRDTARSWELSRRKSISPHDALGSNIQVHIDKYHKVVRVLPLENEALNECWLSDRDRFSYEGLYHEERLTQAMIKQDGKWIKVDWETALNYAAKSINGVKMDHGSDAIGVLASAISTTEELHLLQKMMRGIGVSNLDYRLEQQDFSLDGKQEGTNYLGSSVTDFVANKSILVVGSMLREEQPLLTQRLRQAAKHECELHLINLKQEDVKIELSSQLTVDPRKFAYTLGQILKAACQISGKTTAIDLAQVEVCDKTKAIAESLLKYNGHIVLGRIARSLADYAQLLVLSNEIASVVGGKSGILPNLANELGAQLVGFTPYRAAFNGYFTKGLNASQMLENQRKAYVLLNTELERDAYNTQLALAALNKAETVIVMSAYINEDMLQYADVILPVTPYTETAGSYVNMQGTWQTFNGVTRPLGDAKPAWKVIRVLANKFNLDGFEQDSIEDVRSELTGLKDTSSYLNNSTKFDSFAVGLPKISGLIRFGVTGIYSGDSIVRRSASLQQTALAKLPVLTLSSELATKLNLANGNEAVVKQSHAQNRYNVTVSEQLASDVVLLAKNHDSINFAGSYDAIEINA
jgi:NADH-quinone oxidoreductase subunit G